MLLTGVRLPDSTQTTLRVEGGRFAEAGEPLHDEPVVELDGGLVLPGPIDLHVHGGGGHDATRSPDDLAGAVAFHHTRGTAATLVSLVTAPVAALTRQLSWTADAVEDGLPTGEALGAHLEGPFVSAVRCGAQNAAHLLAPDRAIFAELLDAARGHLRMITIAPELPGALDVIDDAVAAGVVAAIGHTDATYDETLAAIDHGASVATHLFNGMRPIHHREPGPVVAALDRGLICELILDGHHLHPAAAGLARDRSRPVLVTDAIDAAGMPAGEFRLGGQDVVVDRGEARLRSSGALAGSTLTLDAAAGRAIRDGWTLRDLVAATSRTAAELLGAGDRFGSLAPGRRADALVLGSDGSRRGVLSGGRWTAAG